MTIYEEYDKLQQKEEIDIMIKYTLAERTQIFLNMDTSY